MIDDDWKERNDKLDKEYNKCKGLLIDHGSASGGSILIACFLFMLSFSAIKYQSNFAIISSIICAFILGFLYANKRIHEKINKIYDKELLNKNTK